MFMIYFKQRDPILVALPHYLKIKSFRKVVTVAISAFRFEVPLKRNALYFEIDLYSFQASIEGLTYNTSFVLHHF